MSISSKLFDLIRKQTPGGDSPAVEEILKEGLLQADQRDRFEHDIQILDDQRVGDGDIQKEAQKQLREAAETSLRRLHVIQRGRCPLCGDSLRQHLFASVCDSCGWYVFDAPRQGGVRIHLANNPGAVDGDRCYVVKNGAVLVLRVEYVWASDELDKRHKDVLDHLTISCGWCSKVADPEADGFHMAQVAFGTTQERYCFCSDECFEAFRKMYPARVHRNCYERSCTDCDQCVKRYEDEADGLRSLAKDYLKERRR
jgi:hypothetical protein